MDYPVPTKEQAEIIRRNGIDPDSVAVNASGKGWLLLLVYKTRDTIRIEQGDRKWS